MAVEHIDHPGKISQGSREAVDLVDHHDVDQPALNVRHQPAQRRPIHIAARETAIVVVIGHGDPAFGTLAGNKGLPGFFLGIDGVEGLIQTLVAGHAAVHGAALRWQSRGGKPRTRADSKQATVVRMLKRPEGATVRQICDATGWQQHTVRGAFAGALRKKLGLTLISDKQPGGERIYRVA